MMPSVSDLAPVIVAAVMAVFVLLLTWHAWHQAHKAGGSRREHGPQSGE
ncbi:MAG TPA: hypothetical protein VFQ67_09125 [Allosphingosinicella sp.]|jgi:TRAP-type C4-dicarboxylate transport system permease small subunit|nr:hypothetical protein [Allosphingosinicella sp.]